MQCHGDNVKNPGTSKCSGMCIEVGGIIEMCENADGRRRGGGEFNGER
jgi:hypothetical protein